MNPRLENVLLADPAAADLEERFNAVPPEMTAEILDGELFAQPRPARPHTRSATRLAGWILGPYDLGKGGPGGWVILVEPELRLGSSGDRMVPDMAGWRRENLSDAFGDETTPAFYDQPPDWVCEVISPGTERLDRTKKMRIYRREGVKHLWLLTPLLQTLEVYRLTNGQWLLLDTYEGSAVIQAEPFTEMELDLSTLWAK